MSNCAYFCVDMVHVYQDYHFHYFSEYAFHGLIIRDPITALSNVLLFIIGFWCYKRILKISSKKQIALPVDLLEGLNGWKMFFLISSFAYLVGVPVHGLSYHIPTNLHFWIWVGMGWTQNLAIIFVQLGTAKQYFKENLKRIRPLIFIQFVIFSALMVYLKNFGAINANIAVGLVPIACWNIYLFSKKKNASWLMGAGILFAIFPAIIVLLKIMPAPWLSYNDIAHFLLIASLLIICSGIEKNSVDNK